VSLALEGRPILNGPFLRSGLSYGRGRGRRVEIARWSLQEADATGGEFGRLRFRGRVRIRRGRELEVEREFLIHRSLPYLWLTVRVRYPQTPEHGSDPRKVRALGAGYDRRWKEVWPAELRPDWEAPFTVWKHNYWGELTSYRPHYGEFSSNRTLPSFNNHITAGWVAVSGGGRGLLLGQTSRSRSSAAFCPMRTLRRLGREELRLNPFGTYTGPQLHAPIAETGIGRRAALRMAEHLHPLAPSYNGREERFELFIAPFTGERPPEQYMEDAWANAFPPLLSPLDPATPAPGGSAAIAPEASREGEEQP
jgi:hypothetical protein